MLSLALETSSSIGSLALFKNGQLIEERQWPKTKNSGRSSHSEHISFEIHEALHAHHLSLSKIDQFLTSRGPGSFTGIRVGLNTIKSLSYSLAKPILAYDSLSLIAQAAPLSDAPLLVLVSAVKNQFYSRRFSAVQSAWRPEGNVQIETCESLVQALTAPHACIGSGLDALSYLPQQTQALLTPLSRQLDSPKASLLLSLSQNPHQKTSTMDWKQLSPLYIKSSAAEEKLKNFF